MKTQVNTKSSVDAHFLYSTLRYPYLSEYIYINLYVLLTFKSTMQIYIIILSYYFIIISTPPTKNKIPEHANQDDSTSDKRGV